MHKYLLALSLLASLGCARQNQFCNYRESIIISPNEAKIASAFPQVRNSKKIYEDSYIGNSTRYYYPIQINADLVSVPEVSCFAYKKDQPELSHHQKCYLSFSQRYYATHANYIFDMDTQVNLAQAKRIAFAWYELQKNRRYIENIWVDEKGEIRFSIAGGACTSIIAVSKNAAGDYVFSEEEVLVCS